jgi:TRAP-type C4-dicarboxylate transport system permease small subunit
MFKRLGQSIDKVVKTLLVINVFSMLLLSVISIVLRWVGVSFLWVEPLVRHMVFATAFLGATLATATGRHIAIEILAKSLEASRKEKVLFILNKFTSFVTIFALVWLAYSGYQFFKVEQEYGKPVFFGLHSSVLVGIIPVGFSLMLARTICDFLDFSPREIEA